MAYYPPLEAGMEPHPGCRLVQFLGRGGFAEVWKAEVNGGKPLALKFMFSDNVRATPKEVQSIQMVRELRHPGLVGINRVWIHQNYIVVSMELAEGGLDDLLEAYLAEFGTPIPAQQLCLYLGQAAATLDFLNVRQHQLNGHLVAVQHCDVKPSNLLLFGDTIKLSDFGLSSMMSGHQKAHRRAGTPGYAAPEVFQGVLSDRTDQFALAVTYFYLRTGRMPFPEAPGRPATSLELSRPDLGLLASRERPIIARALDRVPQQRWPSCREMLANLGRATN